MKSFLKKYGFNFLIILIISFGIFLRLKGFITNPSFWHDECAMAWNIKFKSYSELFGVLRFLQVTPPLFSVVTKFLTGIFGFSEMVFRFIPFVAGCLSIIGFYFLSSKALNTKFSILSAVFLFAINQRLINYSFEFKPYGPDVFFTIICLLFFINLDIEKLNIKKAVLYGVLLSLIPWFSFVSVFVIAGGFLNLFLVQAKRKEERGKREKERGKRKEEKEDAKTQRRKETEKSKNYASLHPSIFASKTTFILSLILPMIISGLIYLKFYLLANYTGTHMVSDWQDYFVTLNPIKFLHLLTESIRYLFFPIQYILFALILFILGIIIYTKEKSSSFNIAILTFIMFLFSSFLHIYPFGERVIVFLIPIYLLFIIKPFDLISLNKKVKSLIIVFIAFLTFYPQINFAIDFFQSKSISKGEFPREMMEFMVKTIKPSDIIFVNNASNTEFEYYSSFYKLKNKTFREKLAGKPDARYFMLLNSLPKGYYWFYLSFDYSHRPVIPAITSWAQTKRIIHSYKSNKSALIYVSIK